ncbi:MAG: hypothetical protein LW719_01060 [Comamonadaceae bacterium]|nr:hypothetical protein [Comamonadaceae bacterium]
MSQHTAPPVVFPVGPSFWAGRFMVLIWIGAACLTLAWWKLSGPADAGPLWGVFALLLAAVFMLWQWRRSPEGQLIWDAQAWVWRSRAYPHGTDLDWPQIVLDLQYMIVVRMRNRDGAGWVFWLEARRDRAAWLDLRRALYAAPPAAQSDADPAALAS